MKIITKSLLCSLLFVLALLPVVAVAVAVAVCRNKLSHCVHIVAVVVVVVFAVAVADKNNRFQSSPQARQIPNARSQRITGAAKHILGYHRDALRWHT